MINNFDILNKEEVSIDNKLSYIKRRAKYIIGAAIITASFGSVAFGLDKDNDDYYQITSRNDLIEFAGLVNEGNINVKGKLLYDIKFNEGNGIDCLEKREKWTPIGTEANPFCGEFIGNEKTIAGLYVNDGEKDCKGLFGVIGKGGVVSGISVNNACINGQNYIGGIAGKNQGKVSNCKVDSIITGKGCIGGIVGLNEAESILEDCININIVQGAGYVGGNVGMNEGIITGKCENEGARIIGIGGVGGNVGYNKGTI